VKWVGSVNAVTTEDQPAAVFTVSSYCSEIGFMYASRDMR